jgi:hypothetical protein
MGKISLQKITHSFIRICMKKSNRYRFLVFFCLLGLAVMNQNCSGGFSSSVLSGTNSQQSGGGSGGGTGGGSPPPTLPPPPTASYSQTGANLQVSSHQVWHVRPDGGDNTQCDGKTNAAYSAAVSPHCAFKSLQNLWKWTETDYNCKANDQYLCPYTWVFVGGDTVILHNNADGSQAQYKVTSDNPMPPLPNGTASQHTQVLGENFHACTARTQIFGAGPNADGTGGTLGNIFDLRGPYNGGPNETNISHAGSDYVDLACLELTDHVACAQLGNPTGACGGYNKGDTQTGIITDTNSTNLTFADMDIHGFSSSGINGPVGANIMVDHVRLAFNSSAGWNFDYGNNTPCADNASVYAQYLTIEWNGCTEEYPIAHKYPALYCYDKNTKGYGDGIGTPDTVLNFSCDHCNFNHNTQDGFDLLHTRGSNISVTNSIGYANEGQQFKMGPMANVNFSNNIVVNNCDAMAYPISGAPSTFNSTLDTRLYKFGGMMCRAFSTIAFSFLEPASGLTTLNVSNNTLIAVGHDRNDGLMEMDCGLDGDSDPSDCPTYKFTFQNNIVDGLINPDAFDINDQPVTPGHWEYEHLGLNVFVPTTHSNNIYNNIDVCNDPNYIPKPPYSSSITNSPIKESCQDPLLVNMTFGTNDPFVMRDGDVLIDATWAAGYLAVTSNLDFHLQSGSPAIGNGTTPALSVDFFNINRATKSLGAIEPQ